MTEPSEMGVIYWQGGEPHGAWFDTQMTAFILQETAVKPIVYLPGLPQGDFAKGSTR
jgi:hypothetical protein